MAKLRVFACRDSKLGSFMAPLYVNHIGQAARLWEEIVNDPSSKSLPAKYPQDFALYEIGTFDEETGAHANLEGGNRLVATGADVKRAAPGAL